MQSGKPSKPHANVVFLGHVGCGKTTLAVRLLTEVGAIDSGLVEKQETSAGWTEGGRFQTTWVMDSLKEERERGLTINIHYKSFESRSLHFTLIDVPGHRDFIRNTIAGAYPCDIGVLVVSAVTGEFEAGISSHGQTREHALLAFTVGIKQLMCCVDKMDDATVNWSQTRFEEVMNETKDYLRKVGYNSQNVNCIPVSGLHGDNVASRSDKSQWYQGPTLLDALDAIVIPRRAVEKPLRAVVLECYRVATVGTVASCYIATGEMHAKQQQLTIAPELVTTEATSIEAHHITREVAITGDIVGVKLANIDPRRIRRGMIISDLRMSPARECLSFTAQVIILNHPGRIGRNYTPIMHSHAATAPVRIVDIPSKIDRRTGRVIEERPESVKTGEAAMIVFMPMKAVCVEAFANFPSLGRFALRDMKLTVAVGVIKEVREVDLSQAEFRELRVLMKEVSPAH